MYKITPAAYIFTHQYLNTMQQGIQSAHVIAELSLLEGERGNSVREWAKRYKTIRILNAGSGETFNDRYERFKVICEQYKLSNAYFCEPDINNMMTAFGFIMAPQIISQLEYEYRELIGLSMDPESHFVFQFLNNMASAR